MEKELKVSDIKKIINEIKLELSNQILLLPQNETNIRLHSIINNTYVRIKRISFSHSTLASVDNKNKITFYAHNCIDDYENKYKKYSPKTYLICILAHEIGHTFDLKPQYLIKTLYDVKSLELDLGKDFLIKELKNNIEKSKLNSHYELLNLVKEYFLKSPLGIYLNMEEFANDIGNEFINRFYPNDSEIKDCYEKFLKEDGLYIHNKLKEYYTNHLEQFIFINEETRQDLEEKLLNLIKDPEDVYFKRKLSKKRVYDLLKV